MKILGKQPSREKCAESGWFATDYLLDQPIDREFILSLKPLGSFVYLDMLKEPFFKIESDYYMIKGVQGKIISESQFTESMRKNWKNWKDFWDKESGREIAGQQEFCYTVHMTQLQEAEDETGT